MKTGCSRCHAERNVDEVKTVSDPNSQWSALSFKLGCGHGFSLLFRGYYVDGVIELVNDMPLIRPRQY